MTGSLFSGTILEPVQAYPNVTGPDNISLVTYNRISVPAVRLHFIRLICIRSISMQVIL